MNRDKELAMTRNGHVILYMRFTYPIIDLPLTCQKHYRVRGEGKLGDDNM